MSLQLAPRSLSAKTPTRAPAKWVCVQTGHREQYGIARALERAGVLERLVTDIWASPDSILGKIGGRMGRRLRDRFHPDLPQEKIKSFPVRSLAWELSAGIRGPHGSKRILARNEWWSSLASTALPRKKTGAGTFVFSYCYDAKSLFLAARERGITPVLGQIDPGPVEDAKVAEVCRRWPEYRTGFQRGSHEYYADWREECRLAGHIVVNSDWSRRALIDAGIDQEKIGVCPLVYTPPVQALGWEKSYPGEFTKARPLKVLFLGQCILRKGIAETIEAAKRLSGRPVQFDFVGNTDITDFRGHFGSARIHYSPRVSRTECQAYYQEADVFLFPTHSDGFGLTQLEAQAWKLPLIASRFCADVVEDNQTGWILPSVSSDTIVRAIERCLLSPTILASCSRAIQPWPFDLDELGRRLTALQPRGDVIQ